MRNEDVLQRAAQLAIGYLRELPERRVAAAASLDDLRRALGGPMPEGGEAPVAVIQDLAERADAGLVASAEEPEADAFTREVVARVQGDGTCWLGGTIWRGRAALRISISNWSTTETDVDRSAEAILRAGGR
jgi:hypothetical protein